LFRKIRQKEKALTIYEKGIKKIPDDSSLKKRAADLLIDQERYVDAKSYIKELPADFAGLYLKGRIYLAQNKLGDSIFYLKASINEEPLFPYSHFNLGLAYMAKGDFFFAQKELLQALGIFPTFFKARIALASTYIETSHFEEALSEANKIIQMNKNYSPAYRLIGDIKLLQKRPKEALNFYETAINHNPGDPRSYIKLGQAYRKLKKNDKAVKQWEKALSINPKLI